MMCVGMPEKILFSIFLGGELPPRHVALSTAAAADLP